MSTQTANGNAGEPPTTSPLSAKEIACLTKLKTGLWLLKDGQARPGIQSLIDRGYCRTSKVRIGPLGIYTGDTSLHLTEAGRTVLEHIVANT